jgi:hypothetical protein
MIHCRGHAASKRSEWHGRALFFRFCWGFGEVGESYSISRFSNCKGFGTPDKLRGMLATVCSAAVTGIEAYSVEVEVNAGRATVWS